MQVKEDKGNYICLKHNQIIKMIVIDQGVPPADLMHCLTCLEQNRQPYKLIAVDQAKDMIREKLKQLNSLKEEKIHKKLQILQITQSTLSEFKSSIVKAADDINRMISSWVTELTYALKKDDSVDLIKGLQLLSLDQSKFCQKIEQDGKSYFVKIDSALKKILTMDGIMKSHQEFMQLETQIQEQQINPSQSLTGCQLINQIKQEQDCHAIAFNCTDTIMAAGYGKDIKLWQFNEGKLNVLTVLICDGGIIECLIFSKKKQFFLSGEKSGLIQLWKQGKNIKEWLTSGVKKKNIYSITCMVLNNNEDQLISCSEDKTILVWQVKFDVNQLDYQYALETKHTEDVLALSLNMSESELVSCGYDQQIILWVKGQDDKWTFRNSLKIQCWLPRILFITDSEFLVQYFDKGYTNVFKIVNQQLIEQQDLKITLNNQDGNDSHLFPTIYNKRKGVIIQKSCQFVYILARQNNGQFKVLTQPIDNKTEENFGSLSESGEHLAIWDKNTKELKIHKLTYGQ